MSIEVNNISKVYGDQHALSKVSFSIAKGEVVGFLGPNGAGKSTLVKLLLGDEEPTTGRVQWGSNIRHAYFSQHAAESLDLKASALEALGLAMPDWNETQCRGWLARFLFMGDDVFKKVEMLSGGEKNKLVLACMLLNPVNLLILDEPTNHLDLESIQAFNNSLKNFKGTVIFTTHDHEFARTVANRIIEITPKGVIDRYSTFDEYLEDPKIKELRNQMYS